MPIDSAEILAHAAPDAISILLFGSYARGDASSESDIDVLQVCPKPLSSYVVGSINYSNYTLSQLLRMAHDGSLFVLHLTRECIPIRDPDNILDALRTAYRPKSPATVLSEVHYCLALLHCDEHTFAHRHQRFSALALHLLRTAAYARSFSTGGVSFSMQDVASRLNMPELASLPKPFIVDWCRFVELTTRAVELTGHPMRTAESIDSVIVNAWPEHPMCVALGLRLLAEVSPLPYDDLDIQWSNECQ